ncbi:TrbI/VirB10 family protein [Candidatus Palauibacter sp.]|uniref:TrbI/VirB10 family protein n=1 Tax=Candidatus Palauibacter sp. TaxID=3101350 RepID=UPI003B527652
MSSWKQWMKEPKGALPGGIVTKAGIALITVLVAGLFLSSSLSRPDGTADGVAPTEARPVDDRTGRALDGRFSAETERQSQQAAADADRERRQSDADGREPAGQDAGADAGNTGTHAGIGQAEFELREALRLEEVERRTRSLRSPPVAQSHREPNRVRDGAAASSLESESPDAALDGALASLGQSLAALEAEMAAGLAAGEFAPGEGSSAAQIDLPTSRTSEPGRFVRPEDPPGWERVREGSFLEAVLLTQLSGEFPGPVLAMVSVPLYSVDRQRVLIPRGTRVVGTARAVQHRDQSRLAVAFHRLLLPDGSWVDLEFAGLNQVGESALRDQVNRRYLSTFAAAGAVGALSGLTLAGASPYGLRAGVGQGLGSSATSMLDRYLNRLPEITIRAGHRLRIWFNADVLVPTPTRTTHR